MLGTQWYILSSNMGLKEIEMKLDLPKEIIS